MSLFNKIKNYVNLTLGDQSAVFSETREVQVASNGDPAGCPNCGSKEFVKRGLRKKKLESVQLYKCRGPCGKTFTARLVKGKRYPIQLVIDALSIYNLGFGYQETCRLVNQRHGTGLTSSTLAGWYQEYSELCRYSRLRSFGAKLYRPEDAVVEITMAHRQLYRFRYHRAKIRLTLKEFRNRNFEPLKDYLDAVAAETPHQYFQDGLRMSEIRTKFDKSQMIIRSKKNYANRLAEFALQAVQKNKDRHEAIQRFMLANDSVTVATEVPVFIRKEDIEHLQNKLNFKVIEGDLEVRRRADRPAAEVALSSDSRSLTGTEGEGSLTAKGMATSGAGRQRFPKLLTGHIDLVQVRNGQIHILDYKPNAAKEKPIEQLTWYALALSRLTGLRVAEFKCAWFDEKDFFEFYPLHVVKKLQDRKRKKRVYLKSYGTMVEVPGENKIKIV